MNAHQDQSSTTATSVEFPLPVLVQSSIVWLGWPVLYVVTIAQTIVMLGKLFRRQRGYPV